MTPTNGEDGMVEVCSAFGGVKNTRSVGLEDHLVGLNGDSEWLSGKGSLHLRDVISSDGSVR